MHGFVSGFLIEPCTPPHDPNIEYDLVMPSMLEQANAMGKAGIANTKYDSYHIPYEEYEKHNRIRTIKERMQQVGMMLHQPTQLYMPCIKEHLGIPLKCLN